MAEAVAPGVWSPDQQHLGTLRKMQIHSPCPALVNQKLLDGAQASACHHPPGGSDADED